MSLEGGHWCRSGGFHYDPDCPFIWDHLYRNKYANLEPVVVPLTVYTKDGERKVVGRATVDYANRTINATAMGNYAFTHLLDHELSIRFIPNPDLVKPEIVEEDDPQIVRGYN